MTFIDVTSNVEVGEVRCAGPMSVAPSFKLLLLFLQWWKWAKRGSYGESSFNGELGFHEQFWQRQDTCDCGYEMRGLHHLFIVGNHAVLGLWFHLFRVFSSFTHYFIFFSSFLKLFAFLEEFWIFLEEKRVLWPFWRHFKPFGGFLHGFMGF